MDLSCLLLIPTVRVPNPSPMMAFGYSVSITELAVVSATNQMAGLVIDHYWVQTNQRKDSISPLYALVTHQGRQNVVRTSVAFFATLVSHFFGLTTF